MAQYCQIDHASDPKFGVTSSCSDILDNGRRKKRQKANEERALCVQATYKYGKYPHEE